MGFNDVLYNGEAEAGAALVARPGFVGTVETFKDTGDVIVRNADAVVGDIDEDVRAHVHDGYRGPAVFLPVIDGVHHEIVDHLLHPLPVGDDFDGLAVISAEGELDAPRLRLEIKHVERFLHERHDIESLRMQLELTRLKARDGLEILNDGDHPVDALLRPLEVKAVDRRILKTAVKQREDVALNIEDGRLQFMGYIADELFPVFFELLQLLDLLGLQVGPVFNLPVDAGDEAGTVDLTP